MKIWKIFGNRFKQSKTPINSQKSSLIDRVAIFGFADTFKGEPLYDSTFSVSKLLAESGYTIVQGGGPGVMLAASEGAVAGGGKVIGVTLSADQKDFEHFEGRESKNHMDQEYSTPTYVERTLKLLEQGQAYVIFQGGTGTISEFGMAWGLARLQFGKHRPLILYGSQWQAIMEAFQESMPLRPEELKVYKIVETPQEVLQALLDFETGW